MTITDKPPFPPRLSRQNRSRAPLSYSQESLWFLQQLDPDNNAYNSVILVRLTGGVDRIIMEKAVNEIVRRHDSLRTVYPNEGGKPVQVIKPFEPFSIPFLDFSNTAEEDRLAAVQSYTRQNGNLVFDLLKGPLARCALLHTGDSENYLFFCTHHINFDAWSQQIFIREIMQIYDAYQSGIDALPPDPLIQYSDYALWQREWLSGDTLKVFTDHWKNIFYGDLPILEIPTDHPRPAIQTYNGKRYSFSFQNDIISQVKLFCQRERITPFQLYLSVFATLLGRYSGQEDIIIGCPFANRFYPELDNLIGLFVNTLPIRVNLSSNPKAREILYQVRDTMTTAFEWQSVPFEALVSAITPDRDLSRNPIFQVAINMRNVPLAPRPSDNELRIETILRDDAPAPFDLSLEFEFTGGIPLVLFQYNTNLFDEKTIVRMVSHYQNLLREFLTRTDQRISDLEMLTPSEQNRILNNWNKTEAAFPQVCLHDLITDQAKKDPSAVAVVCNGLSLTYGELERRANQLANFLRTNGVENGKRVGIFLPRSEQLVIALLAVLKAGGAYVPLDLTYPHERIAYMVEDSSPVAILTTSQEKSSLPEQYLAICLDKESSLIDAGSIEAPPQDTTPDSTIYVIYTSGSTGRPKGAINIHRGIVNHLLHAKKQFQLSTSDRVIHLTSMSFDISVLEVFGSLCCGSTIYLMDDNQMRDPDYINLTIQEQQITCLSMVPTMLRALCRSAIQGKRQANHLRLILPAGEALLRSDVELTRQAYGNSAQLVNLYGPTECSSTPTNYPVPLSLPSELQVIPIGKPISNSYAYVLDKYLNPVPAGVRGELFLGGVCVGPGYLNQPELTAERFLPDPFHPGERMYRTGDLARYLPDGNIYFLGRNDDQVKIRGYRVEPGELETAINSFPGIRETVVNVHQCDESASFVAYITTHEPDRYELIGKLRNYLAERLPFYMLPSSIMVLDKIPLLLNGKVDRKALPDPVQDAQPEKTVAPRNETERKVAEIWKSILGIEQVGIRDNFFELGGHSIMAAQMFTRLHEDYGRALPLRILFEHGTVEALAAYITNEMGISPSQVNDSPDLITGEGMPIYVLNAGSYLSSLSIILGEKYPLIPLFPYEDGQLVYRDSIQETAGIYYKNIMKVSPKGPFRLLGHSANGLFALELARLLRQDGKEVSFLGFLDTHPPTDHNQVSRVEHLKYHMDNLKKKNLSETLRYLYEGARRVVDRQRRIFKDRKTVRLRQSEGQNATNKTALIRTYKPEPYDGNVTIFSVTSRRPYIHWDPMSSWAELLTGQFEIVPVEGDHISLLAHPQVDQLAEKILAVLERNETD